MRSFPPRLAVLCALALSALPALAGELLGPGVLSTGLHETSVAMTADRQTVYFVRSDLTEAEDTILVSQRVDGHWSTPRIAPFSGRWHDSEPTLSPDGKRLYFVSNRPPKPGAAAVTAHWNGHDFAGTNLWYVERRADGGWGAPVHIDGALNDGAMLYNPSVARSGAIYFSAHRPDSGKAYQIYVVRPTAYGYGAPERVELGGIDRNRMDPAIDPDERFIVYAGNEGDALGRADLYIAFRRADGSWGTPLHLDHGVNSDSLENAPSLGPRFGELFVSSNRRETVHYPLPAGDYAALMKRLRQPLNGDRNLWRFDISGLLVAHGVGP